MERVALAVQVCALVALAILLMQVSNLTHRLDARDQNEVELLEARIIVLEKQIGKLQAQDRLTGEMGAHADRILAEMRKELRNVRTMQSDPERNRRGDGDG